MSEFDDAVSITLNGSKPPQDNAQAARLGFSVAQGTNPDQYAEAKKVAGAIGVPVDTALNLPNETKQAAKMGAIKFDTLAETSPATARLLADIDKAKLTHDDLDNASQVEDSLSYLKGSSKAGFHDLLGAGAKVLDTAQPFTVSDQELATLYKNDPEGLARMRDKSAATGLSRFAREQNAQGQQAMADVSPTAKKRYGGLEYATTDPSNAAYLSPTRLIGDLVRNAPTAIAMTAVTALTKGAATKAEQAALLDGATAEVAKQAGIDAAMATGTKLGATTEGVIGYAQNANQTQATAEAVPQAIIEQSPAYQDLIKQGYDPVAAKVYLSAKAGEQSGVVGGAFDAVAGAAGGRIMGRLLGEGGSAVARFGKGVASEAPVEAVQSGVEQASNNAGIQQNVDPNQKLGQGVAEATVQGATIGGLHSGILNAVMGQNTKIKESDQAAQTLEAINAAAQQSKLLQRSPETFKAFVEDATKDGEVQNVFINADALYQSGMADKLAALSPSVAEQLPEALATGGQIQIPIAEYATNVAASELSGELLQHLKTDPEGYSQFEKNEAIKAFPEEMQAEVERALMEQTGHDNFKASTDSVRENIKAQLTEAGRTTGNVNEAYAALIASRYATLAAKLGTTPEALFADKPLSVVGEGLTGFNQETQNQTQTKEFKNWFGNSKVVDENGNPRAVYHGSGPDIAQYSLDFIGKGNDQFGSGFYFATAPNVASGYAMDSAEGANVQKNFLNIKNPLNSTLKKKLTKPQIKKLLLSAPDLDEALWNYGDVSFEGKNKVLNEAINSVFEYQNDTLLQSLHPIANDFFSGQEGVFLEAVQKTLGYDGVQVDFDETGEKFYVAFNPTQIKSAIGNKGTFDPNDTNILNQTGPSETRQGVYSPEQRAIALLSASNLSTFLHESGHFFLDMQFDIAAHLQTKEQLTEGEQSITNDTNAILSWFGVQDLNTWNALSFEEMRSYHEKFAEGFEVYLFEGNAPSIELRSVFQEFRAWLMNVYRKLLALSNGDLKTAFGSDLSPEIKGVMDRMLATNDQINLMEQARGMLPLFSTPEQGHMSPDEFAAYQAQGAQATQDAIQDLQAKGLRDMVWSKNLKLRVLKDLQKQAADARALVKLEVTPQVMSEPIYRAWQFLTSKLSADDKLIPKPREPKNPDVVQPERDDLLAAIAKLGGLNKQSALEEWGQDPAYKPQSGIFGKPVWRATGGLTVDEMGEALNQYGYLEQESNGGHNMRDFENKFDNALRGTPQYSVGYDYAAAEYEAKAGDHINPESLQAGRLDAGALLEESVDPAIIEKLKALKMTAAKGLHPDIVADMFGFSSGDELVNELAFAEHPKDVIQALVDQKMLEDHGELSSASAIERAADSAIHNDVRARMVGTEARALARATGQRAVIVKAAKEFAAETIARTQIKSLTPGKYTGAEAKAAKAAEAALRKGDLELAAANKRNQLYLVYAAQATLDAKAEVNKSVKYLQSLITAKRQDKMRGEYLAQLNALLARFDLRKSLTLKELNAKEASLADWVNSESERLAAVIPDLPGFITDENYKTQYKNMSVEEFRGLVESVKQLELLAKREQQQYLAIRAQTFAQERESVLAVLRENFPKSFGEDGEPTGLTPDFVPTLSKALKDTGDKFIGEFISPENIIDLLERGNLGAVHESLFSRLTHASDWKSDRLSQVYKDIEGFFKAYSKKEGYQFSRKGISVPEIGTSITRENAVMVALLYGSEDGRSRLQNYGWGNAQIDAIVSKLTNKDLDLVQGVWNLFDKSLWPEIEALNMRTRGKAPPKINPVEFEVNGRKMTGGYMRLKYDTDLDERAHRLDEGAAVKELLGGGMGMSSKTNQGTSTERKQNVTMRPRLDLGVFAETVNESIHDLAYREAVADTIRMLNDRGIMNAIKTAQGVPAYRALVSRVREVAAPPRAPAGFIEKALSVARKNTVVAMMSGVKTALQNFTGLAPALAKVPVGVLASEVAKFYSPKMGERVKFAMEQSAYMRNRFDTFDRDLASMTRALTVDGRSLPSDSVFLGLMALVDRGVSVPVWHAAFKEGMKKFENNSDQATDYADKIVRQTQGSGRDVDMAQIMSGHGGWGQLKKVFTMFHSYFNGQLGLLVTTGAVSRADAQKNPGLAAAQFAAKFTAIVILPAVLTDLLMNGFGDRDPEDEAAHWGKVLARYGLSMLPIVRDIAAGSFAIYDPDVKFHSGFKLSPIESAVETAIKVPGSISDMLNGESNTADTKTVIMGTSVVFGLPGKLISDTVLGTNAWLSGQAGPQAVILGPPRKQ